MFVRNSNSFSLIRGSPRGGSIFSRVDSSVFLPNSQSFSFARSATLKPTTKSNVGVKERKTNLSSSLPLDAGEPVISVLLPNSQSFYFTRLATLKPVIQPDIKEFETNLSLSSSLDSGESTVSLFLPNSQSFYFIKSGTFKSAIQSGIQEPETNLPSSLSLNSSKSTISDKNKRDFLKVAGIAGVSLGATLFFPSKAHALIMGSSPTTGVVGVKNSSNTRINPATEETLGEVLKTTDLTFDAGALEVKIAGVSGVGSSSFSDSGDVARSALVDGDRHVQVDVLSSALPSTASTETTLQTISFGGFKFSLRLDTVGDIDYIGEASIGTITSAASWRIKKVDSTTGIIVQWAGTGVFDQIWDNRAALSYS